MWMYSPTLAPTLSAATLGATVYFPGAALAATRLCLAFDAAADLLDDTGCVAPADRAATLAALHGAIGAYVTLRREQGATPERVLTGVKGALHRRQSTIPPSQNEREMRDLVFGAFLRAYYPTAAAAAPVPATHGPLSRSQWATIAG